MMLVIVVLWWIRSASRIFRKVMCGLLVLW